GFAGRQLLLCDIITASRNRAEGLKSSRGCGASLPVGRRWQARPFSSIRPAGARSRARRHAAGCLRLQARTPSVLREAFVGGAARCPRETSFPHAGEGGKKHELDRCRLSTSKVILVNGGALATSRECGRASLSAVWPAGVLGGAPLQIGAALEVRKWKRISPAVGCGPTHSTCWRGPSACIGRYFAPAVPHAGRLGSRPLIFWRRRRTYLCSWRFRASFPSRSRQSSKATSWSLAEPACCRANGAPLSFIGWNCPRANSSAVSDCPPAVIGTFTAQLPMACW